MWEENQHDSQQSLDTNKCGNEISLPIIIWKKKRSKIEIENYVKENKNRNEKEK